MLVYQDDDNALFLRRAMCYLPSVPGRCVGNGIYFEFYNSEEGVAGESESSSNSATRTIEQPEAYLRLIRDGRVYTAYFSDDGLSWTIIGRHEVDLLPNYVGLIASNAFQQPAIADFDYFTLEAVP